jgi:hypothetical protein
VRVEKEKEEEGADLDLALLPEHELGFLVGAVGGIECLQRLAVDVEQRLGAGVPQEVNLPRRRRKKKRSVLVNQRIHKSQERRFVSSCRSVPRGPSTRLGW